jgi:uncharacterized damage-inducible protein DinB
MARYNKWANKEFADYFQKQTEEALNKHIPGSFPSIHKTLTHISNAQDIWIKRLQGESPTAFRSSPGAGTFPEVIESLASSSDGLLNIAEGLTVVGLDEVIHYKTMTYGPQASRRYEILLHVFNHSMYHRGQCITMARLLDLESVPSTDLIKYLRTL